MDIPKKMRLIRDLETPSVSIKAGSVFEYDEHSDAYYFPVENGNYGHDRDKVIGNHKWFEPAKDLTHEEILNLPIYGLGYKDEERPTIKEYLKMQLLEMLEKGEYFNCEDIIPNLFGALADSKIILGKESDGSWYREINEGDIERASKLVKELIETIWT